MHGISMRPQTEWNRTAMAIRFRFVSPSQSSRTTRPNNTTQPDEPVGLE